ncbi:MAG: LysM peptidoglycan-binding domain-containing protein [Candidatus Promineifilaceae bacterium]
MLAEHRVRKLLLPLLVASAVLTACERPLSQVANTNAQVTALPSPGIEPTVEGAPAGNENEAGTPAEDEPTRAEGPTAEATQEATAEATEEATQEATAEATAEATEAATAETTEAPSPEATQEPTAVPTSSATASPEPSASPTPAATATPAVTAHTVAEGENLYRIGLLYGVSWLVIADFNDLTDADAIAAGQVLLIPPAEQPEATPPAGTPPATPPAPPSAGVNYTVQPGDNLYRIGLAFSVSWIQIAEANGIINPNQIYPGQVLKIPSSMPGPAPQFTHVVQPGESLFRLSLRYGIAWMRIAQANEIASPYVIYPGQTLVIPGG